MFVSPRSSSQFSRTVTIEPSKEVLQEPCYFELQLLWRYTNLLGTTCQYIYCIYICIIYLVFVWIYYMVFVYVHIYIYTHNHMNNTYSRAVPSTIWRKSLIWKNSLDILGDRWSSLVNALIRFMPLVYIYHFIRLWYFQGVKYVQGGLDNTFQFGMCGGIKELPRTTPLRNDGLTRPWDY